jgi:hypothetical protein
MFSCSLAGEFREAARRWPQLVDVEQLTLAAIAASWLEEHHRSALSDRVAAWWRSS